MSGATEADLIRQFATNIQALAGEAVRAEAGFDLAPDRYVLRVLAVLSQISRSAAQTQRLIVERAILSNSKPRPSARQMAAAMGMATSTLTRWSASPLLNAQRHAIPSISADQPLRKGHQMTEINSSLPASAASALAPISEAAARLELKQLYSAAANPARYDAWRKTDGWLFGLRRDSGPVLMGTVAWIVADNGRASTLSFHEHADDVIAREMARGPR